MSRYDLISYDTILLSPDMYLILFMLCIKKTGFYNVFVDEFLVHLFRRKSRAIVIARLSLLSCKNFNVVLTQKVLEVLTLNLEYLLINTRCSWKTRGIILNIFGVMSLFKETVEV